MQRWLNPKNFLTLNIFDFWFLHFDFVIMPQTKASIDQYIDIFDIRDDVLILKDKTLRAVLMCSAVNFALKSSEEQNAITYAFQGFLNSLDFFVQVVISSRQLDLTNYLKTIEEKQVKQENELLQIQIAEYINFVKGLTEMGNIMTTDFYIIIPFAPVQASQQNILSRLQTAFAAKTKKGEAFSEELFDQYKNQLWQRVEFVSAGLANMSIQTTPLNTQNLIELLHLAYNPGSKKKEIAEPEELQTEAAV